MMEMDQSQPRSSDNDLEGQAEDLADELVGAVDDAVEPYRRGKVFYAEGLCVDWIPTSPSGIPGHITAIINNSRIENVLWNRQTVARTDVFGKWCRILITPQRILFDDIIPQVRAS